MMKRLTFISLMVLLLCMLSINVLAYEVAVDNEDGKLIYYNYINDATELEVTYRYDTGESYTGIIKIPESVIISNKTYKVTSIGYKAFYKCTDLTEVTIPDCVTNIGDNAFDGCINITSIIMPNSVNSIGIRVFADTGLTSVSIPGNITNISKYAFYCCNRLASLTIGNGVQSIGERAFYGCTSLSSIYIPNSVTHIDIYAFSYCGLTSISFGAGIRTIKRYAFWEYNKLEKVILRDVGAWCDIEFENEYSNPIYYAKHIYSDENTEITDLVIPKGPTSISDYAFYNCSGIRNVTIGNSVTEVGKYAFYNCSGLESVTIGNSVTKIDNYVFYGCSALTTIYSLNPTPPILNSSFDSFHYNKFNVFVPQKSLEDYKSANVWKDFLNLQGFDATGVESINSDAIDGNNVYYDLNGNRLDAPKKGLNIINGKKVVVK